MKDLTVDKMILAEVKQAYMDAKEHDKGKGWAYECPILKDEDFITKIILRAMLPNRTGRSYVQYQIQACEENLTFGAWFSANSSPRRVNMLDKVMFYVLRNIRRKMLKPGINHLDGIDVLENYDCLAFDGHCIKSASHTKLDEGLKNKVNSCFIMGMDMRTGLLMPATVVSTGQRRKNELPCLEELCAQKALKWGLRYNQISVYDRALSSYELLDKEAQSGHYWLTREKKSADWTQTEQISWDRNDPFNINVISDSYCYKMIKGKLVRFRVVEYFDPLEKKTYRYLSRLSQKVPPGVIAELYRRRWQIEKSYDNSKNSLFEQKAWGCSLEAHKVQMHAIVAALNFIRYFQEMNIIDYEQDSTESKSENNRLVNQQALPTSQTKAHQLYSSFATLVHRAQLKQEKRWRKQNLDLKELGLRLNPLRYIGHLMRITEACVDAVRNSIFSQAPIHTLQKWLRSELRYRHAD